jgi:hypothetical protein
MSSRITVPFSPAPKQLGPRWLTLSFYQRAVGAEINRVLGSGPVELGEEWQEVLCKRMEVNGRDRQLVKRGMDALVKAGLLVVSGGFVQVLFMPTGPTAKATSSEHRANTERASNEHRTSIENDQSVRNDSDHLRQNRIEEKREDPPVAPQWSDRDGPTGRRGRMMARIKQGFTDRYEKATGGKPIWGSAATCKLAEVAVWAEGELPERVTAALDGFFLSEYGLKKKFSWHIFAIDPAQYIDWPPGSVAKRTAAVDPTDNPLRMVLIDTKTVTSWK